MSTTANRESQARVVAGADRLHALDALRALAMLLVIVGHAMLSYIDPPYGSIWVVRAQPDASSRVLSLAFWWLHGFRLPLYFVLAGFFAARLSVSRGAHGFMRHRLQRIVVPLVVGTVVLLPICFYVFAFGWWLQGICTWNEIRRVRFSAPIQSELWGPVHLWFLQYLLLYAAALWLWQLWSPTVVTATLSPRLQRALRSWWRPLWCAVPSAVIVGIHPDVVTTHHNRFLPEPFEFVHYAMYFAWGVCFHRLDPTMARFLAGGRRFLIIALGLFVIVEALVRRSFAGELSALERVALGPVLALYAWFSIFAFVSLFQRFFAHRSARLQYLADAAYWIYLVHLPIVAALQIAAIPLPLPALVKCALVIGMATAVCLWSYERWVRYGVIGAVLNGHRARPPLTSPPPSGGDTEGAHLPRLAGETERGTARGARPLPAPHR